MNRITRTLATCLPIFGFAATAVGFVPAVHAEDEHFPKIVTAQNGADELYKDLEYLLSLTNTNEQKQWAVIRDYMDVFLPGIDVKRPIRVDVILSEVDRYISSFPITKIRNFRNNNLFPLGINTKKWKSKTRYKLNGAFVGFMRYKHKYAVIAEKVDEVPQNIANPGTKADELLKGEYDLAGVAVNTDDGQAERREHFKEKRKEILATLKQGEKETLDDFDLRKTLLNTQLDELDRIVVEGERLELNWKTQVEDEVGAGGLYLKPLAGTSLEATFKLAGAEPSYFANISRHKSSILSFRLNHLLDDLRKGNLLNVSGILKDRSKKQTEADETLDADEKTARKQLSNVVYGILEDGTNAGIADGFLEAHSNESGAPTLIGGLRTVDGTKAVEAISLLSMAHKGQQVEIDFAEQGDVKIHKLNIPETLHANFKQFFGSEDLYVGTSKDAIWVAMGQNAVDELKAAIQLASQPKPEGQNPPFLSLFAKMLPWIELREMRSPEDGDKKLRGMALEAFKLGDDTFDASLIRVDDHVEGQLNAHKGILRFAGKVMADFSEENLDDGNAVNANARIGNNAP